MTTDRTMPRTVLTGAIRTALLLTLLTATPALAQGPDWPAADPSDVESTDGIVTALYESISGGAGVDRDWDRFRSLFRPGGTLTVTGIRRDNGEPFIRTMTLEEYITGPGAGLQTNGFFEIESHRVEERFGHIAHAFSTYESRRLETDPEPFQRGINSIQLHHDGARWYILTVLWDSERADNPIPDRYTGG